jgi:fermentation-respiration switch protein FrsA (DUF1100 family)
MAIVAIAVADDAFIHPEPGTSATDHLAAGLVPIAVALALAIAYPRLGAGVRALAALICGVLALTAGVADGVRHVAIEQLAGDDLTAIAAALAGVALVALGATTLWRTRRLDEPLPRRYLRRALTAALAIVGAFFVVLPVGLAIVVNHKARSPVERADLGRAYEDVELETSDGLRLSGWYVPSRNGAAVIVFPGRSGAVRPARILARHGYGVLVFDRRGEGESEGDYNARGWGGEPDLHAAIGFLDRRPDVRPGRIGGLGISVGGELMLQTAARTHALAAVVSEGAGMRSVAEQLHMPDVPGWRRWIAPMTVETAAGIVLSGHRPPPDLVDLMPAISPRPVLLIRAEDGNVDERLNTVYYEAAGRPKQLWTLPEGGHTGALDARPREYERRVVGFFDGALLGR